MDCASEHANESQSAANYRLTAHQKLVTTQNKIEQILIIELMTCKGKVHEPISQTLNVLCAILSRDPTSHIPMSPTFVPTALQQNKLRIQQNMH